MRFACTGAWAFALLTAASAAAAHRLDEYLQATTISLQKDRVQLDVRLHPGIMVWTKVLALIDSDKDGVFSEAEIKNYAERMQRDLSLAVNGKPVRLRFVAAVSDRTEAFERGLGEIHVQFVAEVSSAGAPRRVVFENRHERRIASYLVNALVPTDADIRITAQNRNHEQSWYQLDYVQSGARAGALSRADE